MPTCNIFPTLTGLLTLVTSSLLAQNARLVLYVTWLLSGGVTTYNGYATDHVMNSPGLLPPFLHTASDQKLEA